MEELIGSENIGLGESKKISKKRKESVEVKHYDPFFKKLKIAAYKGDISQYFYLKVYPEKREYIESMLKEI